MKIRAAKGRRRKPFPSEEAEFQVATVDAFAGDGHSVLVYCPVRKQTESLAKAFLRASKQDYLEHVRPLAPSDFEFAAAIGREWLGESHCAYDALEAGIGIHHGALPRPFLGAIEHLLHQRKLSVVIASPTLAQGLDLSCNVLVFRSLQRYEQENGSVSPRRSFRTSLVEWGERSLISTALQCNQRSMLQSAQASKKISPT